MNYYDEEININDSTEIRTPPLLNDSTPRLSSNNVRVERISARGSNGARIGNALGSGRSLATLRGKDENAVENSLPRNRSRQRTMIHGNSTDDDGLLQDIIDHDEGDDDGDDDDDDDDDSEFQQKPFNIKPSNATNSNRKEQQDFAPREPLPRTHIKPSSSRIMTLPSAKILDLDTEHSETESEGTAGLDVKGAVGGHAATSEAQINITPDKWESLNVNEEIKELFPFILKYTPQNIETAYHLQPFIPDFVPSVGDVDAFLKVTEPPPLQTQRSKEIEEHLYKLGLHFLDEPSGTQSEPSLLNMKLRSALTGSGRNARSGSASVVPTAKSPKDIDKWINEVEQVHMAQSALDAQPRKDIENMIIDWPRSFAQAAGNVQDAYRQCMSEQLNLIDYIRVLCQQFAIEGPLETQSDYLLCVQTLFALYLAANQAWE